MYRGSGESKDAYTSITLRPSKYSDDYSTIFRLVFPLQDLVFEKFFHRLSCAWHHSWLFLAFSHYRRHATLQGSIGSSLEPHGLSRSQIQPSLGSVFGSLGIVSPRISQS
ncbi:hypothetical protein TWF103_000229 [Orbilia oligospora]|nr:hypothetical protein TWF103_000229 [Orbilia oligospora]